MQLTMLLGHMYIIVHGTAALGASQALTSAHAPTVSITFTNTCSTPALALLLCFYSY
jgi:hypothetical protein